MLSCKHLRYILILKYLSIRATAGINKWTAIILTPWAKSFLIALEWLSMQQQAKSYSKGKQLRNTRNSLQHSAPNKAHFYSRKIHQRRDLKSVNSAIRKKACLHLKQHFCTLLLIGQSRPQQPPKKPRINLFKLTPILPLLQTLLIYALLQMPSSLRIV